MNINGWMLPPEALSYIVENLPSGSRILEFGSGNGSITLSESYHVTSIEHDQLWLNVAPVKYIHAPIVDNEVSAQCGESGWYDIDVIRRHSPFDVDFVIIDGPPGDIGRRGLLAHLDILPPDVDLMVDDVDREDERALMEGLVEKLGLAPKIFESGLTRGDGTPRAFAILSKTTSEGNR